MTHGRRKGFVWSCCWFNLLLGFSILVSLPHESEGRLFFGCDISDEDVVDVALNPITGLFEVIDERDDDDDGGGVGGDDTDPERRRRRNNDLHAASKVELELASSEMEEEEEEEESFTTTTTKEKRMEWKAISVSRGRRRRMEDQTERDSWQRLKARKCLCSVWRNSRRSGGGGSDSDSDGNSTTEEEEQQQQQQGEFHDWYCPAAQSYCMVPSTFWNGEDSDPTPICATARDARAEFLRILWPVSIVWIGLMMAVLVFTGTGRGIVYYLVSFCYPRCTHHVASAMLRREPLRAQTLFRRRWLRHRRRRTQPTAETAPNTHDRGGGAEGTADTNGVEMTHVTRRPTRLALRTKLYDASSFVTATTTTTTTTMTMVVAGMAKWGAERRSDNSNNHHVDDDDDDDEACCSICLAPLEDGDRIGDLPCEHLFHADCLKGWLAKRNACPLCQTNQIAEPLYDPPQRDPHRRCPPDGSSSAGGGGGCGVDDYDTSSLV